MHARDTLIIVTRVVGILAGTEVHAMAAQGIEAGDGPAPRLRGPKTSIQLSDGATRRLILWMLSDRAFMRGMYLETVAW